MPHYGETMGVGARIAYASFVAAIGGCCVGVFLAVGAMQLAQATHYGCTRNRIDGQQVWSCPDGLGYVIPALSVVALTCVVALMITTATEFRHDNGSERTRAAALVMTVVGALLIAQGGFSIPVSFTKYSPLAGWASITITAAGLALVLVTRRNTIAARSACVMTVVLVLACAPGVYLLAPVMIALAGYLLAAATLLTNRARPVVDVAR